jgi:hypothetical protein
VSSTSQVSGVWDNPVETQISEPKTLQAMIERLSCTPGITHFLLVDEYPLGDFDDVLERKLHFAINCRVSVLPFAASAPANMRSAPWWI